VRILDGLGSSGESDRYGKIWPKVVIKHKKVVAPVNGLVGASDVLLFEIQADSTEIVRFPVDCINLKYTVTRVNPDYNPRAGGGGVVAMPNIYVQPQLGEPPIYINPYLAGRTFVSSSTVSLDGVTIPNPKMDMDNGGFHYQVANRIMCDDRDYRNKFGEKPLRITGTKDRTYRPAALAVAEDQGAGIAAQPAVTLSIGQKILRAMEPLIFDEQGRTAPRFLACGMDEIWPLNSDCHALNRIMRVRGGNKFLHPGVKVALTLHKANPMTALIERLEQTVGQWWALIPTPNEFAHDDLIVSFQELSLTYESVTITDPAVLAKFEKEKHHYLTAYIHWRSVALAHGVQRDQVTIHLPHGCKMLFILFLYETQIHHRAQPNHFLSARYRYPSFVQEIDMSLVGRESLIFKGGLTDLTDGSTSTSLRAFVAELQRDFIYPGSFDDYWPRGDDVSFDQILPLRTDYYPLPPEGGNLTMVLKYSQVARERMSILAFPICQRRYSYDPKTKWTYKDLS
jgi:hypothetical protein